MQSVSCATYDGQTANSVFILFFYIIILKQKSESGEVAIDRTSLDLKSPDQCFF